MQHLILSAFEYVGEQEINVLWDWTKVRCIQRSKIEITFLCVFVCDLTCGYCVYIYRIVYLFIDSKSKKNSGFYLFHINCSEL